MSRLHHHGLLVQYSANLCTVPQEANALLRPWQSTLPNTIISYSAAKSSLTEVLHVSPILSLGVPATYCTAPRRGTPSSPDNRSVGQITPYIIALTHGCSNRQISSEHGSLQSRSPSRN